MTRTAEPGTRHTFRQRGPVVLGWVCVVACLGMLAGSLPRTSLVFAGLMLLGAGGAFVLLIRPSLELNLAGVHVNNPLRRTTIPWPLVDDCLTRWNLQVYAGERVITAWAISSQIERPKRGGFYGGGFLSRGLGGVEPPSRPPPTVTAAGVSQVIEQGREEWQAAVVEGTIAYTGQDRVLHMWEPLDVALLVVPAVLVAIGIVTGS